MFIFYCTVCLPKKSLIVVERTLLYLIVFSMRVKNTHLLALKIKDMGRMTLALLQET